MSQTGRSEPLMKIDEKGSLGVIRIKKGRGGGNPKDLGIMAGKNALAPGISLLGWTLTILVRTSARYSSGSISLSLQVCLDRCGGGGPMPGSEGPRSTFAAATEGSLIDRHEYLMVGVSGEAVVEFLASGLPHRRQL